ncbi:tryptophan synthase subunit beta like protein [Spiribacter vilamensis]|uniref:Tryptophan synthase subunit beta like protein n=1 Tax=Spiribacter vilamensis TaxID=531306 RepID=A0A4Q8D0V1_9GAMM|nr:tryptophan synthase subunit beta like protein [Spiribacter vilamensis]RZU98914.1 hypothetical protein EV698_1180 [Spiribacter vilamensis]
MARVYVARDADGAVTAVAREPSAAVSEPAASDDPAVQAFLGQVGGMPPEDMIAALQSSDTDMVRVIEDLTSLLIERGVIQFTDLPVPARQKLLARQEWRGQRDLLDLVSRNDADDDPFMP